MESENKENPATIEISQVTPIIKMASATAKSLTSLVDILLQRGVVKGEEVEPIAAMRKQAIQLVQSCENYESFVGESK